MKEYKNADASTGRRPYGEIADDLGSQEIPSTIFEAELDLSHPLIWVRQSKMQVFRDGEVFMEKSKNPYASRWCTRESTPGWLFEPQIHGYHNKNKLASSRKWCWRWPGDLYGRQSEFPGALVQQSFVLNALFFGD